MDHDTIIIGGGPAGLFAAIELSRRGHDVRVMEEHDTIGVPDHCAGLLSTSGLKRLGVQVPSQIIQNSVSGARIYSPSGYSLLIERGKNEALVIDRRRFDAWLADTASRHGARITTGAKVNKVLSRNGRIDAIKVREDSIGEPKARIFLIAEGSRCQISGGVGLPIVKRSNKYPAYQYEVSNVDINEDLVEMFYGHNIAPGFFAWIIPLGDGRARVGLGAQNHSKLRLDALFRHHKIISERMQGAKIERTLGGVILVGLPINKMVTQNVVAIGDTAGMVKATTGGGVILGGLTARIAGKTVDRALSREDIPATLKQYESQCKALFLQELRIMYLAQRMLTSLSDKGLDSIIKDAAELGLLDVIRERGDMDFQGRVIRGLLKDPRMFLMGCRAIRYINPFL